MEEVNNGAGLILKTARERQRRDIASIAQELGISQRYIVAIEDGDLKNLPGGFYYKSFVRQYAAIIGVDEKILQPGIDSLLATLKPLPLPGRDPSQPPPARDVRLLVSEASRLLTDSHIGPSLVALITILAATSGLYAWFEQSRQSEPAARITPVPPEQVRRNFGAAIANSQLTPAEIDHVVAPMVGGLLSDSQTAAAPAVVQSALKAVQPLAISAPPNPDASMQVPAALVFQSPPRKSQLRATGVLQEQAVRRVLPEVPVEDRGIIPERATVVVSVIANQSGDVTEASVEESDSPVFNRLATEAAGKWRFVPSKTVSSREYFLRFEITGAVAEATLEQSTGLRQPKER